MNSFLSYVGLFFKCLVRRDASLCSTQRSTEALSRGDKGRKKLEESRSTKSLCCSNLKGSYSGKRRSLTVRNSLVNKSPPPILSLWNVKFRVAFSYNKWYRLIWGHLWVFSAGDVFPASTGGQHFSTKRGQQFEGSSAILCTLQKGGARFQPLGRGGHSMVRGPYTAHSLL